jgi:hypothetical protein
MEFLPHREQSMLNRFFGLSADRTENQVCDACAASRYSPSARFFILRANQALISFVGVLLSGYTLLYYMLDVQMF